MKTQHTPGPYWRDDNGFIAAGHGENYVTFADASTNDLDIGEREANTDFIIRACNSRADLLAAIEDHMNRPYYWDGLRAAIARAKGKA